MPKRIKQPKQSRTPDIRTYPIHKGKSFIHNLNAFIKMLQEHHSSLTSRLFLIEVHSFVNRYKSKNYKKDPAIEAARHKIKICKQCDGWSGRSLMLQCLVCEDYYHEHCLDEGLQPFRDSGLCQECDQEKTGQFDKEAYLTELI